MRVAAFVFAVGFISAAPQASGQAINAGSTPEERQFTAETLRCGRPGPDNKALPAVPFITLWDTNAPDNGPVDPQVYSFATIDCFVFGLLKIGQDTQANLASLQAFSKSFSMALLSRLEQSEMASSRAAKEHEAEMLARIELLEGRIVVLEERLRKQVP